MKEISAYFDGNTVRPLEAFSPRKNQMLKITVLENFYEENRSARIAEELCGILHNRANPKLIPLEKSAWEQAAGEKHGAV